MASIKNHSLLVVQTNEQINSIRFDVIKDEMAPMALQDDALLGTNGTPGVMFPGPSMIYDTDTGELNVSASAVRKHLGEIGYQDGQRKNMSGLEVAGGFYVVTDYNYKYLHNDWGTPGSDLQYQTRVYIGDIVEKRNDKSGDWEVIRMHIGDEHVNNDFVRYPHISRAVTETPVAGN